MIRYYLTNLKVEGFRGINNEGQPLELRFDENKVNSIYGMNGFGKSSLFDALSYCVLGHVPKLESLEQAEDPNAYLNNRFHTQAKATIQLTFAADDGSGETEIVVERESAGTRTVTAPVGVDGDAFLKSLRSDFILLDQDTLRRFIRGTSLERGRSFSRLIGLSQLADYRLALQKLANAGSIENDFGLKALADREVALKAQQNKLVCGLREAYNELSGQRYTGEFDSQRIANDILQALRQTPTIRPLCEVALLVDVSFAEIQKSVADTEKSNERSLLFTLTESQRALQDLAPLATEASEQAAIEVAIRKYADSLAETSGTLLQKHYRTATMVLEDDSWENKRRCPTCDLEQPGSLLEALQEKLAAFRAAEQAATTIKDSWKNCEWVKRWQKLDANTDIRPSDEASVFSRLNPVFLTGYVTAEQLTEAISTLQILEERRVVALKDIAEEIARVEVLIPTSLVEITKRVASAKRASDDLQAYDDLSPKLKHVQRKIARRNNWKAFISKAYHQFASAERQWVSNRQSAIAEDYQKMHDAITRNAEVVPELNRPSKSERLQLRLQSFYGLENLSANTLLQESYCNAVAISTFLSAALLCPTPARFLVLDDITSSFDGGHQYNLMEVLRKSVLPSAAPNGLQIILLSHDTMLEKYLDKATNTGTWRHQKLLGNPPSGPVLTEQYNRDRIRQLAVQYLSRGETDAAAPWIRPYLESVLSQIIRKTKIPVPIDYAMDDNKKMVQNALNAINNAVALQQQAKQIVLDAQQISDSRSTLVPALISNYCAHFNTGAYAGISSHVLLGVLDDVDKLADCFKYDCTCQYGPPRRRFYKSLIAKDCRC